MLKQLSNVNGAKNLTKDAQKNINGGLIPIEAPACGGDGSFIFVNGQKVCCWVPRPGWYIC
ncbi:MAG: hypothetical protein AAFQ94_00985 [Bacteroidota bacterium]